MVPLYKSIEDVTVKELKTALAELKVDTKETKKSILWDLYVEASEEAKPLEMMPVLNVEEAVLVVEQFNQVYASMKDSMALMAKELLHGVKAYVVPGAFIFFLETGYPKIDKDIELRLLASTIGSLKKANFYSKDSYLRLISILEIVQSLYQFDIARAQSLYGILMK